MNAAGTCGVTTTSQQYPRPRRTTVMAGKNRQERPGISPSRAGLGRRRVLSRGAALSGLATAAVLVAACGAPGGYTGSSGAAANSGTKGNTAATNAAVSARQLSGIGTALVN